MSEELVPDSARLIKLAHAKMPFGKYEGRYLSELPDAYLVWFKQKGFPKGELGRMLMEIHEIKMNGLEPLLRKIRVQYKENK
ncbi:MAG TPA: DUF3820 family protein [Bacteroidales bacterium]